MPWSSNATFLVALDLDGDRCQGIYKPHRGERPLWDFPDGLYVREVAAFAVSAALGWGLVPETILRDDAPFGPGSLQRFVEADFAQHYFTLVKDQVWHDQLRRMAVFDLLVNNADRKSGHCLVADDHLWGIDHGLCFHVEPKLRTVIWDFGGTPIPEALRADAARVAADPPAALAGLLNPAEIDTFARRAAAVACLETFPDPDPDLRPYPWPLV